MKLQPPGLRNIKTAIAIFICLIAYSFIDHNGVIFAALAVLICMQDSVEKSVREGMARTIGTIMGAVFGVIFVYLNLDIGIFGYYLALVTGLVILIHFCNMLNIRKSIQIAGVVYLVIIFGTAAGGDPVRYSIYRTLDTLFGIIVAVIINRFFFNPKITQRPLTLIINENDKETIYRITNYTMEEKSGEVIYTVNLDENRQKEGINHQAGTSKKEQ